MHIDERESHYHFSNSHSRELDFNPEGLNGVVIEWCEKIVSGKKDPLTRRDDRKYEYRVRAVRVATRHILMDTGKYIPIHRADEVVRKFTEEQKEMDALLYNRG
jgi:hypothetical protein